MDMIINVFSSLGVDSTVFVQFGLFVFLFLVIRFTWIEKLKNVLLEREQKTSGLSKEVGTQKAELQDLEGEFNQKRSLIYKEGQEKLQQDKEEIHKEELKRLAVAEEESAKIELEKRKILQKEISEATQVAQKSKNELKESLLNSLSR